MQLLFITLLLLSSNLFFTLISVSNANPTTNSTRKTVLVTGAAGFIGSHVAAHLLERGDRVVVVDEINDYYDVSIKLSNLKSLQTKYGRENLVIYRGDICNENFTTNIFETEKLTHVCHLAARAGVRPSIQNPYIYVHSNIEGTTRLLDLSSKFKIEHFVYASSSSVYGKTENINFSEKDITDTPISPYAASKKSTELLAYTFHHLYKLQVAGLRFFTVYGPRGRPDMAPYKFIEKVYWGDTVQQFGDGSTSRDYTYIDDIVQGVVASIDRPLGYQIYNLGNGKPCVLKDFIAIVEKHVGKKANIEILPPQPGDVDRTNADISHAKKLLGYNPQIPFDEGIRRTVEWYREYAKTIKHNPDGTNTPLEGGVTEADIHFAHQGDHNNNGGNGMKKHSLVGKDGKFINKQKRMKKLASEKSPGEQHHEHENKAANRMAK